MLPKNPLVSVILIAYNHEKYIRTALESIVMQRVSFDYEVIVAEDCSTDATPQILMEYAAKFPNLFQLILHSTNVGVSKNARDARKKCRGKYIAVIEGDDYWTDPLKLQKQADFLEAHPEYSACAHEIEFVDEENRLRGGFSYNHFTKKPVCTLEDVEEGLHAGQTSSLLYKNIFLGFTEQQDKDYCMCDCIPDLKLMLLLTLYGPVYRLSDTMSAYRYITAVNKETWSSYSHNNNLSLTYLHWAEECIKMAEKIGNKKIRFKKYIINAGYHAWVEFIKKPSLRNLHILFEVFERNKYKTCMIVQIIIGTACYPYRVIKRMRLNN